MPPIAAAKLALYTAMRRQRITAAAVAGALARCDVLLAICPPHAVRWLFT